MAENAKRLRRQFTFIAQRFPALAGTIRKLQSPNARFVRVPIAILLVIGGVFSFLPVLGIWMLPLGLMVLALDIPILQRPVGRIMVWARRQLGRWFKPKKKPGSV